MGRLQFVVDVYVAEVAMCVPPDPPPAACLVVGGGPHVAASHVSEALHDVHVEVWAWHVRAGDGLW